MRDGRASVFVSLKRAFELRGRAGDPRIGLTESGYCGTNYSSMPDFDMLKGGTYASLFYFSHTRLLPYEPARRVFCLEFL